jgi:cytoskeletal protein CcmA (bactofilin family)
MEGLLVDEALDMVDMLDLEEPDTVIGEGVCLKGELQFKKLLRIDGQFEGELTSAGCLIMGPKAVVRAKLSLRSARIEGELIGSITVSERLELRSGARVVGQITAPSMSVEEGVQIEGHVNIGSLT